MNITLTHTRLAPAPSSAPHQTPGLEPAGLVSLSQAPTTTEAPDILDVLEAEAIFVVREIAAEYHRPVLLFSEGKDSVVMSHLAHRALWPAPIPLPVLYVGTSHNFPKLLAYRDRTVEELGLWLVMACVQDYTDDDRLCERTDDTRNPLWTIPLLDAIKEGGFDGAFGGGHHDGEKARVRKRIVSLHDKFDQWDPCNQRPELQNLLSPRHRPSKHVQVFPLSNWTELDAQRYIEREDIALPNLHYAHEREVFLRDGTWLVAGGINWLHDGEQAITHTVRYHIMDDMSCTGVVESIATTSHDVVLEVAVSTLTEWGATRADGRLNEAAMEDRKKENYS